MYPDYLDGSEIDEAAESLSGFESFELAKEMVEQHIIDGYLPEEIYEKIGFYPDHQSHLELVEFYGLLPSDDLIENVLDEILDDL
ncbi:hypothetical protein [Campylobacter corcagiensis]|uniref:Uncharacterized protein n=1 Tax=Campylobacter corcagiensis TaxID=1448857 RepID=A0A7M1LEZ9_9BACT|nr:hypothetical protein [Campylobacter corcagiensis]QKF64684.1 hypothetical protein CCORG_0827 [Campylobacter corcagiensis]QOQ87152.1 hypothetical protein IMC76_08045 [Campylobacter corcagiensis]